MATRAIRGRCSGRASATGQRDPGFEVPPMSVASAGRSAVSSDE